MAGSDYGQGASRAHAALAPRSLGLRVVIAKGFARIHRQNLINFGILPLIFDDPADYDGIEKGAVVRLKNLRRQLRGNQAVTLEAAVSGRSISTHHQLSERQVEIVLTGGLINWMKEHTVVQR